MVHFEKCQNKTFECFFRVIFLLFPKLIIGKMIRNSLRFTVMEFAFSILKRASGKENKFFSRCSQSSREAGAEPKTPPSAQSGGRVGVWAQAGIHARRQQSPEGASVASPLDPPIGLALGFHPPLPHFFSL